MWAFQAALILHRAEEHDYASVNIPGITTCPLFSFCNAYLLGVQINAMVLTSVAICYDPVSYVLLPQCNCNQSPERRHKQMQEMGMFSVALLTITMATEYLKINIFYYCANKERII